MLVRRSKPRRGTALRCIARDPISDADHFSIQDGNTDVKELEVDCSVFILHYASTFARQKGAEA